MSLIVRTVIPLLFLLIWSSNTFGNTMSQELVYYVSQDGNDTWSGTLERPNGSNTDGPFRTIIQARDAIRERKRAGKLNQSAKIVVTQGRYFLSEPLQLWPKDSGTEKFPITYTVREGDQVLISGGKILEGEWTKTGEGLYTLEIPAVKESGFSFRQLFVDGKRATRARTPNADSIDGKYNDWYYARRTTDPHTIYIPTRQIDTQWAAEPGALVHILAESQWFNELVHIESIDSTNGVIKISGSETQGQIRRGNPFFISGVRKALDMPGEWYLDHQNGRLYYRPISGDPNDKEFIVPVLNRLVEFTADQTRTERVQYITIKGFTFSHAADHINQMAVRTQTDGAIQLHGAHHCAILDNHITNVDGYGIWLHLDSKKNYIQNNTIDHTGAGGILLTSAKLSYQTSDKVYDSRKAVAEFAPLENEIIGNHISRGGVIRYYCSGIHMDSRPHSTALDAGNLIAANHIHHMSRNGIFAFRNQGGHIIVHNYIHDVMQKTADGAAIHFATTNQLAAPVSIKNNLVYRSLGVKHGIPEPEFTTKGMGIYLDWRTSHCDIEKNMVSHTQYSNMLNNGGRDNRIVNNIFVNDLRACLSLLDMSDNTIRNEVKHNIVVRTMAHHKKWQTEYPDHYPENGGHLVEMRAWGLGERTEPATREMAENPTSLGEVDYNLYWNGGKPVQIGLIGSFENWQAKGMDLHSKVSDPLFQVPKPGLYLLKKNSPAIALGMSPIRKEELGPEQFIRSDYDLSSQSKDGILLFYNSEVFVTKRGPWKVGELRWQQGGAFEENFLYVRDESRRNDSVEFEPKIPATGRYEVFLRWTQAPDRATNVPVRITHATGMDTIQVNQQHHGFMWMSLGTFEFDMGKTGRISIYTKDTDGSVSAGGVALIAK